MKPAMLLLFLFARIALGSTDGPPIEPTDDFAPLLLIFALAGICIVLFLVGVGMVAAAIAAASTALLMALGMVSSAAFVGLLRRRFSAGLRAFHYQICAVAALPAGIGALWLGSQVFGFPLRLRDVLAIGSAAGICAGLLLAFAFDRLAVIACRRFVSPIVSNVTARAGYLSGR